MSEERFLAQVEASLRARITDAWPAQATVDSVYQGTVRMVSAGGKRLRARLLYASACACQRHEAAATTSAKIQDSARLDADCIRLAVAVELLHAYTLVHDDLPCMDDADTRRGQKTIHRQYDEATAVLAGDWLQTLAFRELAASAHLVPASRRFADVASDIVIGQAWDLALAAPPTGQAPTQAPTQASAEAVRSMQRYKTAGLFALSAWLGGLSVGYAHCEALFALGGLIGETYQKIDDLIDAAQGERGGQNLCTQIGQDGVQQEVAMLLRTIDELSVNLPQPQALQSYLTVLKAQAPLLG